MTAHYDREPIATKMDRLSMPIPEAGCHAWLGKIGTGGYAYVAYMEGDRKIWRKAATVALELVGRSRPEGLEVDHLCRSRWCVNPDHMRYATRSENSLNRGPYRWVPYCKHCGQLKEQVTGKKTEWVCKPCRAQRSMAWRLKQKDHYDGAK